MAGIHEQINTWKQLRESRLRIIRNAYQHQEGGLALVHRLTNHAEELLAQIIAHVFPPSLHHRFALLATGGFGRRALAPSSDLDLCVLFDQMDPELADHLARFERILWDIGAHPGLMHLSLAGVPEAFTHRETATALLHARLLTERRDLFHRFHCHREAFRSGPSGRSLAREFLRELESDVRVRLYDVCRLQPDLKRDPCMLRDIQRVTWTESILEHTLSVETIDALPIFREYHGALWQAADLYHRLRVGLHLMSRRKQDVMELTLLEQLASEQGFESPSLFLRHFYQHVRNVSHAISHYASIRLHDLGPRGRFTPIRRQPVADGVVRIGRTLYPGRDAGLFGGASPTASSILFPFEWAARTDGDLAPGIVSAVRESVERLNAQETAALAKWPFFRTMLEGRGRVARLLALMHEAGMLGRILPEFEPLTCLAQFDYLHEYTVDSHTLLALWALEDIERSDENRFRSLATHLSMRGAFRFAMLMHDCAKPLGMKHPERGAKIAMNAAARFGFSEDEIAFIGFLVREHLTMSIAVRHRDFTSADVVNGFVETVASLDQLNALFLLTHCDILATHPSNWTGYLDTCFWSLYRLAAKHLEQEGDVPLFEQSLAVYQPNPGDPDQTAIRIHTQRVQDPGYANSTPFDVILAHVRLAQAHVHGNIDLFINHCETYSTVSIIAEDRPGMLRDCAGLLSATGLSIQSGRGVSRSDGLVFNTFHVCDAWRGGPMDAHREDLLRTRIAAMSAGTCAVPPLVRQYRASTAYKSPKTIGARRDVQFDNTLSSSATTVEVHAPDMPGLLYDILSVLTEWQCDIRFLILSTQANQAFDVITITDYTGNKITDSEALSGIRSALLQVGMSQK